MYSALLSIYVAELFVCEITIGSNCFVSYTVGYKIFLVKYIYMRNTLACNLGQFATQWSSVRLLIDYVILDYFRVCTQLNSCSYLTDCQPTSSIAVSPKIPLLFSNVHTHQGDECSPDECCRFVLQIRLWSRCSEWFLSLSQKIWCIPNLASKQSSWVCFAHHNAQGCLRVSYTFFIYAMLHKLFRFSPPFGNGHFKSTSSLGPPMQAQVFTCINPSDWGRLHIRESASNTSSAMSQTFLTVAFSFCFKEAAQAGQESESEPRIYAIPSYLCATRFTQKRLPTWTSETLLPSLQWLHTVVPQQFKVGLPACVWAEGWLQTIALWPTEDATAGSAIICGSSSCETYPTMLAETCTIVPTSKSRDGR